VTELSVTTVTKMSKLGYLIGQGFKGIRSHKFMAFASIAVILACLIIMGSASLLSYNVSNLIRQLEQENEIVAFVDENYTETQARALQSKVEAVDHVASAEFVSRQQAMDTFMEDYDQTIMEGIDESVFRDRFIVHLDDISQMANVRTELEQIEGIVKVNAHIDYANSFISVRNVINVISLILVVILIVISLFIMTNTIKLATVSRREEIAIMRMVGATNSFIRLPFVVEGIILGLVGGVLAWLAEWGIYNLIADRVLSSIAGSIVSVIPFSQISVQVLVAFVAIGILVGAFGGLNAIRNYLKV
jgi:cell division transport system permease protein